MQRIPPSDDGGIRKAAGQAAELVPEELLDDAAAGVDGLASELLDEELDESEEDAELDAEDEELFAGLLLDDEPRLSLR